ERGLFYASGLPPVSRRGISPFGHNLLCVASHAPLRWAEELGSAHDVPFYRLSLALGNDSAKDYEMLFPRRDGAALRGLPARFAGCGALPRLSEPSSTLAP